MGFIQNAIQDPVGAVKGLLFGGTLVAGVEVDVLVSESHSLQAELTQIALESGAIITDHVIKEPTTVDVSFEMTNTPGGMVGGTLGSAIGGALGITRTAKDTFEQFENLLRKREPLKLITAHHLYENMIVVGFSPTHSAPYKGRMQAQVRLQQITRVQVNFVGRQATTTRVKTANAQINSGMQQTPSPNASLLVRGTDAGPRWLSSGGN